MKIKKNQCTRIIGFDAGHRVYKHESKCSNLHGHRYTAEITCEAELDSLGRVLDFSVIKNLVGNWIDSELDHNFIVYRKDHDLKLLLQKVEQPKRIKVVEFNPTAENLAQYILENANHILKGTGVECIKLRLWETPNCYADAFKGE